MTVSMRTISIAGLLITALSATAPLVAQTTGGLRGTVTGSAQQPVAGAQVVVTGTLLGARTNVAGVYTMTGVPVGTHTLRVQMIGYGVVSKQVSVTAGQTAVTDFQISEAALTLNEVVVTGTGGEQTRRSQPAQVAVLNTEEMIRAIPKAAMADVLQSKLPGVDVTQGSGATGAAPRIRIRGASSISLSNDPLVFIDGVRVDSRISNSSNGGGGGSATSSGGQGVSRLNDLNPEDIESIEVVKGPAAATLYGADASAGVIQIITKRGQSGSFRQSILSEAGTIDAHWTPPDNWGLCTQALITAGATPVCVGKAANTLVSDNPMLREHVLGTGVNKQVNWNGSGGTPTFKYFLSHGRNARDRRRTREQSETPDRVVERDADHSTRSHGQRQRQAAEQLQPAAGRQPQRVRLRRKRRYRLAAHSRSQEQRSAGDALRATDRRDQERDPEHALHSDGRAQLPTRGLVQPPSRRRRRLFQRPARQDGSEKRFDVVLGGGQRRIRQRDAAGHPPRYCRLLGPRDAQLQRRVGRRPRVRQPDGSEHIRPGVRERNRSRDKHRASRLGDGADDRRPVVHRHPFGWVPRTAAGRDTESASTSRRAFASTATPRSAPR